MIEVISAPAKTAVSAHDPELMMHLNLTEYDVNEEKLIQVYLTAAERTVEKHLRRRLITQDIRLRFDQFWQCDGGPMLLSVGPIQQVLAVKWIDGAGDEHTLDASAYRLIQSREPNELRPATGQTWPVPRLEPDSVTVELRVGYGDNAKAVPDDILLAIQRLVAEFYYNREATVIGASVAELPYGPLSMISGYQIPI